MLSCLFFNVQNFVVICFSGILYIERRKIKPLVIAIIYGDDTMSRLIKEFTDGSKLEYGRGRFDNWCVFYTDANGYRIAPRDCEYFDEINRFAEKYGYEKLYTDYVSLYSLTEGAVNDKVLAFISDIAKHYTNDALRIDVLLSILYMGMIAEERKVNTKLGKRIKRLGMHQLLVEHKPVSEAANFMRGMGWQKIAMMCDERGF